MSVQVFVLEGVPVIKEGDDLASIISSKFELADGDVVAVCSTVVSKAEGRLKELNSYSPGKKAIELSKKLNLEPEFVQAVLEESEEILIEYPILLVKAKFGNICVNAGVDKSNVEKGRIILPPENPDRSAESLRKRLEEITGKSIGVIITDTNGRCFRKGVLGFAIGVSGITVFRNWVGKKDLFGNILEKTIECVADEIAAFANLMMGEGDRATPVVVFRGLKFFGEGKASEIYREKEEDIIRKYIK
ncbi:MAG TPA: coenzyme F420-0:L-glutamate ligase [Archaeoglobaceae archaeon]|nr:coenzyme F420-0:L-glutamate ligase [Archaeoglobaceae archaeon]